jgi:endonuclease G
MVPNYAINTQFGRLPQMETFFMSNICPQRYDTNRGVWQRLEKRIIREYAPSLDHIWVITGPVFPKNPSSIARPRGLKVAIPKSFYAILVDPLKYPHDKITNVNILPLEIPQSAGYTELTSDFITTITAIEESTNLTLFSKLTKAERKKLSSRTSKELWEK